MRSMILIAATLLPVLSATASAQERNYTVTLTEAQWNKIGGVLGKQPYESIGAEINSILIQIGTQQQAVNEAPARALKQAQDEIDRLKKQQPPPEQQP